MRECLRENGDHPEVGYHSVPSYEPEVSLLTKIAQREDMVLSVAHPNFSFTKKLNTQFGAQSEADRTRFFTSKIVPVLAAIGLRNYEVNALATPEWVKTIYQVTENMSGIITFGSDNHGGESADDSHGVFGLQNTLIDVERIKRIQSELRSFI